MAGGVCHDTIVCIVTGGRPGHWLCCDTMLRHGRACTTIRPGGARHSRGGCGTTHSSERGCATTRRTTQRSTRPVTRSVRAATRPRRRPLYGQGRPATRRLVRHDTAGPTRSLGQGWVHTVHLTQSLFMSTIHKVFKKKKR